MKARQTGGNETVESSLRSFRPSVGLVALRPPSLADEIAKASHSLLLNLCRARPYQRFLGPMPVPASVRLSCHTLDCCLCFQASCMSSANLFSVAKVISRFHILTLPLCSLSCCCTLFNCCSVCSLTGVSISVCRNSARLVNNSSNVSLIRCNCTSAYKS